MSSFLGQLKQRRVYRVAIGYAIVAWLAVQIAATVLQAFHAPEFVLPVLIVLLGVGFPVALMLGWAFDVTPSGIKKTPEGTGPRAAKNLRYAWALAGIGLLVAAVGVGAYWFWHFPGAKRAAAPDGTSQAILSEKNATATATPPAPTVAIPEKSIAVLPFDNLSRDPDNAYFAEGVQDEILTRLAKVADLKVISRTSTQHFKSAPENLPEIAKQLGVANILEGSVQKANEKVRVNVQLINARSDAHLWADIYDRKLTDVFAAESEIAKAIADTLQAKLSGSEMAAIEKAPTADGDAYELYLKGRYVWNKRTGADLRKAIEYFNQAISKDSGYALAYVGVADSYTLLSNYGVAAPKDSIPQAKAAVQKALELDGNLGEAHASYGILSDNDFVFDRSISEFERAIQISPNYAMAHHWFGDGPLMALGQFDRAIVEGKRAVELDPLSLINNADLGWIYFNARRYDEAIGQFRETIEIDSHFYLARYYLGEALQLKGAAHRSNRGISSRSRIE